VDWERHSLPVTIGDHLPVVAVNLYGDQVDQLLGQLRSGVRVALRGRVHLVGQQPGDRALKRSRLVLVAMACEVLDQLDGQGEPL
jgi:hypothetical protein